LSSYRCKDQGAAKKKTTDGKEESHGDTVRKRDEAKSGRLKAAMGYNIADEKPRSGKARGRKLGRKGEEEDLGGGVTKYKWKSFLGSYAVTRVVEEGKKRQESQGSKARRRL